VGENTRVFKGSVNVVYATKEGAEKFLQSEELAKYNGQAMIRMTGTEFGAEKEAERIKGKEDKAKRQQKAEQDREAQVKSRMTEGALLELSSEGSGALFQGIPTKQETSTAPAKAEPSANGDGVEKGPLKDEPKSDSIQIPSMVEEDVVDELRCTEMKEPVKAQKRPASEPAHENADSDDRLRIKLWVTEIKQVISEKTDGKFMPAWVDLDLAANKALVRFKDVNSAKTVWELLTKDGPFHLTPSGPAVAGRVLKGEEEVDKWKDIIQQRTSQHKGRSFSHFRGGPPNKRGRRK